MRNPSKEFMGFTWVGWLNYCVLQWFGIRLYYSDPIEWGLIIGVRPMSGWYRRYERLCWYSGNVPINQLWRAL